MNVENALYVTRDLHKTSSNHKQCQKTHFSLPQPHLSQWGSDKHKVAQKLALYPVATASR